MAKKYWKSQGILSVQKSGNPEYVIVISYFEDVPLWFICHQTKTELFVFIVCGLLAKLRLQFICDYFHIPNSCLPDKDERVCVVSVIGKSQLNFHHSKATMINQLLLSDAFSVCTVMFSI